VPIFSITLDYGQGIKQEKIYGESVNQDLLVKRDTAPFQLFPNHFLN